uniref:Peptidase C1-like protein n=1 Tax=Ascaris suum TaxID=6253 RepID=F1L5C3_ASCSU
MSLWLVLFLVSCLLTFRQVRAVGFDGIPGEYCSTRTSKCCPDRDDQCSAPILDNHLCYCDMFCNRSNGNDCCPDFKAVCGSETPEAVSDCTHEDVKYSEGDSIMKNCNKCVCKNNEWQCEHSICLIQEDILKRVNAGRYTWSARNYSNFWGRTLEDGMRYRLGTLFPDKSVQNMNEILMKPRELPSSFDAREKWPLYIHPVRDQGDCASSWSHSTTATSADRLSIITDGRVNIPLSAQQLLSCNQHRQRGCEGGYLDRAWWYIRKLGVVSELCYPYESGATQQPGECRIPKSAYRTGAHIDCPSGAADPSVYRMTPPYRVSSREQDIMTEIITNGPVQATFLVYEDFFMYSGGVYQHLDLHEHKEEERKVQGYHSVRIIGWGEDYSTGPQVKYWLAANSWGNEWGEDGLFRILRGENHCEIESFVIGAWGKGAKKRRFKVQKLQRRLRRL